MAFNVLRQTSPNSQGRHLVAVVVRSLSLLSQCWHMVVEMVLFAVVALLTNTNGCAT